MPCHEWERQCLTFARSARAPAKIEAKRNDYVLHRALLAGIRDAIAGGIAAALNYLDLLAGVLILWYGGSIADPGGAISTGQPITYQLYWNMINTSIQALNDMVTPSHVRRGPPSVKLLEIWADIDPDKGMDVSGSEPLVHRV